MKNKLLSIGLKNELKQTPDLVSKYPDPEMENGIIYKFRNNNISITDFNDKTLRLQTVLKAHIFRYEYAEDMKHVLVYTIPMKYVTPRLFDFCDDYLADTINMLVVGGTGTGKSYMLKILLGKIALYNQNSKITICDYKKSSFAEFEHTNSFYGYDEVPTGIRTVYKEFSERLKANDEERNKNIEVLLIDEYGALIMASEKKEAEEIKSMIAEMLFMGRSLGIRVIIGVQRAEAMYFNAGARDQFKTILALGNISKEQKQMLFSDHKDKMTENNLLGEGYLYIDGQQDLTRIKVLKIDEEQDNLIHEYVSNAMFR